MSTKRILALVLALLLMLSVFVGCSNSSSSGGTDTPATSTPTKAPTDTSSTGSDTPDVPDTTDAPADPGAFVLPIVSDKVEFDIWCGYAPGAGQQAIYVEDTLAYKVAEERTNIHINFTNVATEFATENFNLTIASNDYPDSFQSITQLYSSGFDYYVENEILVDLNNYMEYLPNYDKIRRMDEATFLTTMTDSGYVPGVFMIAKTMQWAVLGPLVRNDFLEKYGLTNPETYDELHNVLSVFKDNGVQAPLLAQVSGLDDWLMVGYDTMYTSGHGGAQFIVDESGKVSFSALVPGMVEYLTMMNQWYSEGLIESDFFSKPTDLFYPMGRMQSDEVGINRTLYSANDMMKPGAINPDFQLVGLNIPTKNKGDQVNLSFGAAPLTYNKDCISTITTDCENIEVFLKWHDYFWTEEGSLLGNYGVEGESFNYDESGKPMFVENIYANPDGIAMLTIMYDYAFQPYQGYWYDWEREFSPLTSAETLGTKDAWGKNVTAKYNLPAVSLTADESREASAILGDCYTYIDECIIKFIIGDLPLSSWSEFEGTLKSLDIDRAVEIYQAAYDRYQSRG